MMLIPFKAGLIDHEACAARMEIAMFLKGGFVQNALLIAR
jgi:hypothetical protein